MRKPSLATQILALNALLITGAVLAAIVAAQIHIDGVGQRRQVLVLVAAILSTVLVNGLVLRRRFAPLERLIATMERADLDSGVRAPQIDGADSADVARLHDAFNRMFSRLEAERALKAGAVLQAQETERARVARDLHDEANQSLTGILLRLEASIAHAPPALESELRETKQLAAQAMEELLRLARELRPAALDDHGLEAALRTQATRFTEETGAQVTLDVDRGVADLGEDEQLVVYRVVQESLSNVAQHAGAANVDVRVVRDTTGEVLVRVHDDGRGLHQRVHRPSPGGHGLVGMRERARLAGGRIDVRSENGGGTTVELRLGGAA
jgi:two-component system, NarL family, sensor histidine kinase UhpB